MMTANTTNGRGGGRSPPWELSPNAPGVHWRDSGDVVRTGHAHDFRASAIVPLISPIPQYDEVDRRLMDTFPASDAVGRY